MKQPARTCPRGASSVVPVRNEVWPLTEESIAASAEHREMAPALILMVIGFENLSPIYHGKVNNANLVF